MSRHTRSQLLVAFGLTAFAGAACNGIASLRDYTNDAPDAADADVAKDQMDSATTPDSSLAPDADAASDARSGDAAMASEASAPADAADACGDACAVEITPVAVANAEIGDLVANAGIVAWVESGFVFRTASLDAGSYADAGSPGLAMPTPTGLAIADDLCTSRLRAPTTQG